MNQNGSYRNIFDINGYFKDSSVSKLNVNEIEKVTMAQFKPDVLRIILSDDKNINTNFTINKKQIIITTNNYIIDHKKEEKEIPIKKNIIENNANNKINHIKNENNSDLKSSIDSIITERNKIIVKFNRNYSKNDIKFISFRNKNNYDNIFDIAGNFNDIDSTNLEIDGIDKIILTQNNPNLLRIKIAKMSTSKVNYELTNRELVIVTTPNKEEKTLANKENTPIINTPSKVINKTIVIDAGHGGDDVGAVGPNKRYEKIINLNVSKYLYSILKQRGYKVYLTRTDDTFIEVRNRTVLANEKNADIFISVHTNSVPKEKANEITGIETFFLSPARSERAKRVAALENKSDIDDMSNSSKDVFLESLNRPRITASHKLAIDVQAGLLQSTRSKYKDINDSGVREGPFWVLVGAQMPSILIELGYVSHSTESKRLYDQDYQQLLASGIANGVESYFSKNP